MQLLLTASGYIQCCSTGTFLLEKTGLKKTKTKAEKPDCLIFI